MFNNETLLLAHSTTRESPRQPDKDPVIQKIRGFDFIPAHDL